MDDTAHLAALTAANAIVRATDPDTLGLEVAACPGWDVEHLVEHLAQVQRWATRIVLAPPGEKPPRRIEAPTGPAVIDWFAEGADALVDALTTVDLDHEIQAFGGARPARFMVRRQAHEAVVHAWDRQRATGTPDAVDPAVASDGIDELLTVLLVPRLVDTSGFDAAGASVHVHTTDVDGEWLVRVAPDRIEVTREHAKGDVALRGPASDLLLILWGRLGVEESGAETFGSDALLTQLLAATTL